MKMDHETLPSKVRLQRRLLERLYSDYSLCKHREFVDRYNADKSKARVNRWINLLKQGYFD